MQPEIHSRVTSERLRDDHGTAVPDEEEAAVPVPESITIRPLGAADVEAVRHLAELEERPVPPGPLLLAEVEGEIEAAVGLEGGEAVANPFAASGEAVSLLQVRREQIRAA